MIATGNAPRTLPPIPKSKLAEEAARIALQDSQRETQARQTSAASGTVQSSQETSGILASSIEDSAKIGSTTSAVNYAETPALFTASEDSSSSKQELLLATQSWPSADSSSNVTPRAGSRRGNKSRGSKDPRASHADEKALAEERRKHEVEEREAYQRARHDDTLKMAYEIQQAAEEELSFHGSIQSGEQLGY